MRACVGQPLRSTSLCHTTMQSAQHAVSQAVSVAATLPRGAPTGAITGEQRGQRSHDLAGQLVVDEEACDMR